MSVQTEYQPVQQRIAALEEEVADLQARVRELEDRQPDAAAQEAFILKTIIKDIQTKGAASDLIFEITRSLSRPDGQGLPSIMIGLL
jgi:predicted  nucleic acid-binding Zn-ribbon protein